MRGRMFLLPVTVQCACRVRSIASAATLPVSSAILGSIVGTTVNHRLWKQWGSFSLPFSSGEDRDDLRRPKQPCVPSRKN